MKKIFKALSILAVGATLCAGVAAAGCSGKSGTYEGSYSYDNYGQTYGMSVKVTVKNNIITNVEDTTATAHPEWHTVSAGWEDYSVANGMADPTPSANYVITTKTGADIKAGLKLDDVSNFRPNPFTFNISVGEDGKIKSFEIVENGSTADRFTEMMPESFVDGKWFVGKNSEDILKAFNNNVNYDMDRTEGNYNTWLTANELSTGASQSDFVCVQAALFASANAEAAFANKKLSSFKEYAGVIDVENSSVTVVEKTIPAAPDWYKWSNASVAYWTSSEAYLLQQYIGMSVSDVRDIYVFIEKSGQPYAIKDDHNVARNPQLEESGLLITGATQSSGRLLLAIQDAIK